MLSAIRKMKKEGHRNSRVYSQARHVWRGNLWAETWMKRGAMWPRWWCGRGVVLGKDNNFPEYLSCTRPTLGVLGKAMNNILKHQHCLLFNGEVYSFSILYIIPFFNCLIFWNWKILLWRSPFFLPNCFSFFFRRRTYIFLLSRE